MGYAEEAEALIKAAVLLALSSVALSGQVASTSAMEDLCALERSVPADVRPFLGRWPMCAHWGGEEPYDAARRREINRAVRELKCNRLDADEKKLRVRYAGSAVVMAVMDRAKEAIDWPACPKRG